MKKDLLLINLNGFYAVIGEEVKNLLIKRDKKALLSIIKRKYS